MKIEISVLVGKIQPLGQSGKFSAINKHSIAAPVAVTPLGLVGDEQADLRVHGGVEKAVHHYAFDHYPTWQSELPSSIIAFDTPGAFGENISSRGLTEAGICIGDLWKLGTALVEVSQARQPCWKLKHRFGVPDMPQRVQTTKRTGWYYRVKEPGTLTPRDTMQLVARPHPQWPLARMLHFLYDDSLNTAALTEMIAIPELSENWKKTLQSRLARQAVEDWTPRLHGH